MLQRIAALRTRPTGFKLFSSPPSTCARLSTYMAKVRQTVCIEESCKNLGLKLNLWLSADFLLCTEDTRRKSWGFQGLRGHNPRVPGL